MRASNGPVTKKRRNKIKRAVEGSWGTKHTSYRIARQTYIRSAAYAFVGRKNKKRDFRRIWINRITSSLKPLGHTYSTFINALNKKNIKINRLMLSEMAIKNPEAFKTLVETSFN